MAQPKSVDFSVVLPVYNEEAVLETLFERLALVCDNLPGSAEIIYVNDGSIDGSEGILCKLAQADHRVKVLSLSRNFGHQSAVTAGLDHACGEVVFVMDSDLQDPPELLPRLLEKLREGYDVVYGIRATRKGNPLKVALYKAFYRVLSLLSRSSIPPDAGDFCAMSRRVVEHLRGLRERSRFIRGLRALVGFRQTGVPYDRPSRLAGSSKYGFGDLVRLALNGLLSSTYVPLRTATVAGFLISGLAFLLGAFYIFRRLTTETPVSGFATLVVLILFLHGVQLLLIGVLGEYLARVFEETKGRPVYIVEKRINFDDQGSTSPTGS